MYFRYDSVCFRYRMRVSQAEHDFTFKMLMVKELSFADELREWFP